MHEQLSAAYVSIRQHMSAYVSVLTHAGQGKERMHEQLSAAWGENATLRAELLLLQEHVDTLTRRQVRGV